ncbi:MAG: hypothetical protein KDJ65_24325 [Anaerolineae bacterium]|nr:hypothetical protein [Anaerolineae bacterium]
MSEPNGVGLGTMGFNPILAKKMIAEAGFTRFEQLILKMIRLTITMWFGFRDSLTYTPSI